MERVLIEREIALFLEEMGFREERLHPTARLLQDLRFDGDNAMEFFDAISTRFGTDLILLGDDWKMHFAPEGLSVTRVGKVMASVARQGV